MYSTAIKTIVSFMVKLSVRNSLYCVFVQDSLVVDFQYLHANLHLMFIHLNKRNMLHDTPFVVITRKSMQAVPYELFQ